MQLQLPELGSVLSATADNLASSRSMETRRGYQRMVGRWVEWATRRGAWPKTWTTPPEGWRSATAGDVADWLSTLAATGLGISTVRTARAASVGRPSGGCQPPDARRWSDGGRSHAGLAGVSQIAGIARRVGSSTQAAGLRTDSFARILAVVELQADPSTPRGRMAIRDAALLSVMRDGLLRRGETAALHWDDLTIEDDGSGRLTVQRSKSDQTGEGAVLWISPQTIEATERWRKVATTTSSMFDLSARSVGRVVTRLAEAVGLQASGHSLRVGMAQDLAASGISLPVLCQAGRWQSPTMAIRYLRSQAADRGAVARYYRHS